jgi:hypothetical protein
LNDSGVGVCGHPTGRLRQCLFWEADSGTKYAFWFSRWEYFDDAAGIDKSEAGCGSYRLNTLGVSVKNGASKDRLNLCFWMRCDFVIGHHPHVVENFEIYNGVPIFYSLGNFIFDQYWAQSVQKELGLGIEITPDAISGQLTYRIELIPMKSENSKSRLMNDDETKKWLEEFIKYGNYDDAMKQMIRAKEIFVAK